MEPRSTPKARLLCREPQGVASLGLYGLLIALLLWPLLLKFDSRLPLGSEDVRTVPLFNQWTIWWNADRLQHGLVNYWDAPIFYPDQNTFAYSEPQPLTMCLAPVVWYGSATLAYNTYLVVSLLLNGWLAHLLLRWLGCNWLAATAGGLMMIALPIVHWQLGVLQLVPLWGILWTLLALAKLQAASENPHRGLSLQGLELGLAMAVTAWMAIYHALFLTTILSLTVLVFGKRLFQANVISGLLLGMLACLILISPMIRPMWQLSQNSDFVRPADIIEKLSLWPRDYLAVSGDSPWGQFYARTDRYWRVNPGWMKVALALCGLSIGLYNPRTRKWVSLLLVFGLWAAVLSLGNHLQIGQWNVWESLIQAVPGFKQVRSPFRYAYFVQLAIALAAAGGLQSLWMIASSFRHVFVQKAFQAILVLLAGLAAIDPMPAAMRLAVTTDLAAADDWCSELKSVHARFPGAALCLPMAGGDEARDFEMTCQWMMLSTLHRVPLVNGYSGFCPQRVLDLGAATAERPLSDEQVKELYSQGLRYFIVDSRLVKLPWTAEQQVGDLHLQQLISSQSGIDVYSLSSLRGQ